MHVFACVRVMHTTTACAFHISRPALAGLQILSPCQKRSQFSAKIERDRRDLQDYAVKYFNDPEETELSTCAEFAGVLPDVHMHACHNRMREVE